MTKSVKMDSKLILVFACIGVSLGGHLHLRQDPGTPHGLGGSPCPHLFYQGNSTCYRVVRIQATWPEALAYCEAYRAELAIIESAEEQMFLVNNIKTEAASLSSKTFWLGASDVMSEGDWQWAVTLDRVSYTNWAPGTPNNGHNVEHCLQLSGGHNFLWNDDNCENKHYFVCETLQ
ncbi:perlucin-like [Ostrea edulis]|uniref:perlucin-like n=1 Tax=Ostrea edulis TaxID=37623 RepID=UPI0024AED5DB|nr:perlucin-like [Ostrea edulis]XP_056004355.1 perlucin-like [Ostrea edulis]